MTGRILITGATGYLGRRLVSRAVADGWSVTGTFFTSPASPASGALPVSGALPASGTLPAGIEACRLDVRDPAAVGELLRRTRPDVVVHAASGREDWRAVADGAAHVAVASAALGVRLVHISSDAVFSGARTPYDEAATPDPVYPYGAAKAAAETAVRAIAPAAAVVRTSLILGDGHGGHELLTHRLIAGEAGGVLFTDEIRTPVHVDDLAAALLELAAGDYAGVLNVSGADAISRYDLGVLVARRDGLDPAAVPAGSLAAAGLHRPADVRLCIDRAASLLSTRLRGAREFLAQPRHLDL